MIEIECRIQDVPCLKSIDQVPILDGIIENNMIYNSLLINKLKQIQNKIHQIEDLKSIILQKDFSVYQQKQQQRLNTDFTIPQDKFALLLASLKRNDNFVHTHINQIQKSDQINNHVQIRQRDQESIVKIRLQNITLASGIRVSTSFELPINIQQWSKDMSTTIIERWSFIRQVNKYINVVIDMSRVERAGKDPEYTIETEIKIEKNIDLKYKENMLEEGMNIMEQISREIQGVLQDFYEPIGYQNNQQYNNDLDKQNEQQDDDYNDQDYM